MWGNILLCLKIAFNILGGRVEIENVEEVFFFGVVGEKLSLDSKGGREEFFWVLG